MIKGTLIFISFILISVCLSQKIIAAEFISFRSDNDTPSLVIKGEIVSGDYKKFKDEILKSKPIYIIFSSNGGLLEEGLNIGYTIFQLELITVVPDNSLCASACALAWLGGKKRYMSNSSKIGFHAAYIREGSYKRETGLGNAFVGAYLRDIGINLNAIKFITHAHPDEIQWLSARDALGIGIEVSTIDKTLLGAKSQSTRIIDPEFEGDFETAKAAVITFWDDFKNGGIAKLSYSVSDCYKSASKLVSLKKAQYCFTMDLLSGDLSTWGQKNYKFPIMEYFSSGQTNNRIIELLESYNYNSSKGNLIAIWEKLAMTANAKSADGYGN